MNTDHQTPPSTQPPIQAAAALLAYTDMGNAERLSALHGANWRYVSNRKYWMHWNGGYWRKDRRQQIMEVAKHTVRHIKHEIDPAMMTQEHYKHAKKSEEIARLNAMIQLTTTDAKIAILEADLDKHQFLLGCKNGVINLWTGTLGEPNRADLITRISPIEYDYELFQRIQREGLKALAEVAPYFSGFLKRITDDSEGYMQFLLRALGYSLTGSTTEEVFFMLYGSGANGKTKLLELMAYIMGDHATKGRFETFTRSALETKSSHSSDIARLNGARFVYANEGNEGSQLNVAAINEITGGDTMTASYKYENEFEFIPKLKLWIATNHKPIIRETSIGIWRRLRLLPFTVFIPEEERNQELLDKMKAEAPGILAALVYGCLEWQRDGLMICKEVKEASDAFHNDQDTVKQFVDSNCQLDNASAPISASQLHARYNHYCHEQGFDQRAVSRSQFYERLEALPHIQRKTVHKQLHFTGIQLHSD